jgi:hypothetical protein
MSVPMLDGCHQESLDMKIVFMTLLALAVGSAVACPGDKNASAAQSQPSTVKQASVTVPTQTVATPAVASPAQASTR